MTSIMINRCILDYKLPVFFIFFIWRLILWTWIVSHTVCHGWKIKIIIILKVISQVLLWFFFVYNMSIYNIILDVGADISSYFSISTSFCLMLLYTIFKKKKKQYKSTWGMSKIYCIHPWWYIDAYIYLFFFTYIHIFHACM